MTAGNRGTFGLLIVLAFMLLGMAVHGIRPQLGIPFCTVIAIAVVIRTVRRRPASPSK